MFNYLFFIFIFSISFFFFFFFNVYLAFFFHAISTCFAEGMQSTAKMIVINTYIGLMPHMSHICRVYLK